jgi:hypothetical protein
MNAEQFNAAYPVGTPVIAYPGVRPESKFAAGWGIARLETTTRTPAWTLGHGTPVVSVEGHAGGICLSHIDVIEAVAS